MLSINFSKLIDLLENTCVITVAWKTCSIRRKMKWKSELHSSILVHREQYGSNTKPWEKYKCRRLWFAKEEDFDSLKKTIFKSFALWTRLPYLT